MESVQDNPLIVRPPSHHDHPPPTHQATRDFTISQARRQLKNDPTQGLNVVYKKTTTVAEINTLPNESKGLIPGYQSMKTILQRERLSNILKLPKSRADILLEGEWSETLEGKPFLLPKTDNDMLIFTTIENLIILQKCQTFYIDGTFKACPSLYAQLHTVHGLYKGYVVPLVFCLLSDKTSGTYYKLFNNLRDALSKLNLSFNSAVIISDFEAALYLRQFVCNSPTLDIWVVIFTMANAYGESPGCRFGRRV